MPPEYGAPWWVTEPGLALAVSAAFVALLFVVWVGATIMADRRRALEQERVWARTAYEDASRRLRQAVTDAACATHRHLAASEVVTTYRRLKAVEPEAVYPHELNTALEHLEPYGNQPS